MLESTSPKSLSQIKICKNKLRSLGNAPQITSQSVEIETKLNAIIYWELKYPNSILNYRRKFPKSQIIRNLPDPASQVVFVLYMYIYIYVYMIYRKIPHAWYTRNIQQRNSGFPANYQTISPFPIEQDLAPKKASL